MFSNYLFLNRCVNDIQKFLLGFSIVDIYTQEKGKLFVKFTDFKTDPKILVISVNPHLPYLEIRNHHNRSKKNTLSFQDEFLPSKVVDVSIAKKDRIIRIISENLRIYISVRGVNSNIFFENEKNEVEFFKNTKLNSKHFINECLQSEFINVNKFPDATEDFQPYEYTKLKDRYPFFSNKLFEILNLYIADRNEEKTLQTFFNIFLEESICVYFDNLGKLNFLPFELVGDVDEVFSYSNYFEAVPKYLSMLRYEKRQVSSTKEISSKLNKELNVLTKKLNRLSERINSGNNENKYRSYGELLLSNINDVPKGLKSITIIDPATKKDITINLNQKFSAVQNANYYFDKAKDEKINFEKSKELYNSSKIKYEHYKLLLDKVELGISNEELILLEKELKIKKRTMEKVNTPEYKFRHYIIEDKYHAFVGKDGKSNDNLSIKFAKQNDYWFHARGLPGSHVVLRNDNPKQPIGKNILKIVASLAAFYSKAKTAKTAPVSYTFAKFVYKKKGSPAGQVMLKKESVLLVSPEIASNCKLHNDDNEV